jgi:hypothetical protein
LWSEARQNEFAQTFKDRVNVARYILEKTAHSIAATALRRKFVGERQVDRLLRDVPALTYARFMDTTGLKDHEVRYLSTQKLKIGGREPEDLNRIAEERAEAVLKDLPPLQKAVQIIDPETAKMLDRIEELKKKGEEVKEELEEAADPIFMAELDQKMTIGAFRQMVKDKDKKRVALLQKLKDIGKEGSDLETIVGKRLYKGLPGLSEAVLEVVTQHLDRSKALDATARRVEEQVKFGSSEEALELLRHFEKDEEKISEEVKSKFAAALESLKVAVKKGRVSAKTLRGKEAS